MIARRHQTQVPADRAPIGIKSIAPRIAEAGAHELAIAADASIPKAHLAVGLEAMLAHDIEQRLPADLDTGSAERNVVRVRQMGAIKIQFSLYDRVSKQEPTLDLAATLFARIED